MPQNFTDAVTEAIQEAFTDAQQRNNTEITENHLLLAFLNDPESYFNTVLAALNTKPNSLLAEVKNTQTSFLPSPEGVPTEPTPARSLQNRIADAQNIAQQWKDTYTSSDHFLMAYWKNGGEPFASWKKNRGSPSRSRRTDQKNSRRPPYGLPSGRIQPANPRKILQKPHGSWPERESSTLSSGAMRRSAARCRCSAAAPKTIRCSSEIPASEKQPLPKGWPSESSKEMSPIPSKRNSCSPSIWEVLIAGTKYRGEFEERLKGILQRYRKKRRADHPLHREVHTLIGAGATEGAMDAANLLKPALARGTLHCIGATTLNEYQKHIEKDAALERRFQPVMINEPSLEDSIAILRGCASGMKSSTACGSPNPPSMLLSFSPTVTSLTAACPIRRST